MVQPPEPPAWLVDSHIHLDAFEPAELAAGLGELRGRLPEGARYGALVPGVNVARSRAALERFAGLDDVWHAVGVHPWEPLEGPPAAPEQGPVSRDGPGPSEDTVHGDGRDPGRPAPASGPASDPRAAPVPLDDLEQLAAHPRVVAIGEIGLDALRHRGALEQELAEVRFVAQLELARRLDLPVVLHVVRAHERCLELLRRGGWSGGRAPRGVVHAWGGSVEQAEAYARLGIVVGIGAAVTRERSRRVRHAAALLPGDGFLLETDAPYMYAARPAVSPAVSPAASPGARLPSTQADPGRASEPAPGAGASRGHPCDVLEVLRVVAALRGEDEAVVRARAGRLFAEVFRVELAGGAAGV